MVDQVDMEKMTRQDEEPEGPGHGALAGVVRELIRTPVFKELLLSHLRGIEPGNARELVRTVVWEDVVFTMSALGATPQMVNWLAEALIELGAQLNNFTLDILKDFMAQLGKDIDTEKLKAVPGAYAPLVNDLLLEDREALDALIAALGAVADRLARASERAWRKIWNTADFGKIRVGITAHLEERMAELEGEPGVFNPVAISNLLGVVPPLTNYLLRALTRAMQSLNLPAEILASAVFQLLEDIDMAELGSLVNALADTVNALHRGNLVLGRDEPRFKAVFSRVSRDLVDNVDGERFKQMLVSLKEDGAVIGSVIADYVFATPESTAQAVQALYLAVGAALRTAAEGMRRLAELPDGAVEAMADGLAEAVDPRELARIINYNAALTARELEARPDLLRDMAGKLLAGLDTEALAAAGKAAFFQVRDAALADPKVLAALEPEAVGERINAAVAAFNRFAWGNPGLMADKISRAMAVVDMDEMVIAASEVASAVFLALRRNPAVIGKALKPLAKPAAVALGAGAAALGCLAGGVFLVRRRRK